MELKVKRGQQPSKQKTSVDELDEFGNPITQKSGSILSQERGTITLINQNQSIMPLLAD